MNRWLLAPAVSLLGMIALLFIVLGYILYQFPGLTSHPVALFLTLLITYGLIVLWSVNVLRQHLLPLSQLMEMIRDLAKGHTWRRLDSPHSAGLGVELAREINRLAEKMDQLTEYRHMQDDRLEAVIKHMASGLMFVNEQGKIVLTNDKVLHLLGWPQNHHGTLYYEAPLPEAVIHMIQSTFSTEEEAQREIFFDVGIRRVDLSVLVAPVLDQEGKNRGVVIVFHDITQLKKLERVRQDFVANVSHELKTPVTSIVGFAETLLDGAMDQKEHLRRFLQIIREEAQRLNRLVGELLQLSQIEQGRLLYHWKEVDLAGVVHNCFQVVRAKAEEKKIRLSFSFHPQDKGPVVEGDEDRLKQIVINLLMNAIQYTPEQGEIRAYLKPWSKGYGICIEDTGIGIPEEQIPRIFERFYRVDKARSRASGGTGLGLAIVKHLVEAHHGEIEVKSEPGRGSTFCVFFPYKQPSKSP